MPIEQVGVIGAGTMGNGIAHVFARSGYRVTLCDMEQKFLDRGLETIGKNLDRELAKGKITAADKARRCSGSRRAEASDLANCDFVIEAATEKFEIKSEIFRDLDQICRPEVILASNTSSISITKLAAVTRRPGKVIGMHFFNPVPVMKLVEVIRGLATSQETFETVRDLALQLDKTPIEVNDAPGFVSNRVLMPLLNEAMFAVMEGVATPEAVDEVFKLGMAHPMGPLTLADFIGLDVCLDIMRVLQDGLGRSQIPPVSAADQDGGCRLAGEEERERFLQVLAEKRVWSRALSPAAFDFCEAQNLSQGGGQECPRPHYVEFMADTERSRHLHSWRRARHCRRSSRRKVWRLAADRALRADGNDAAGCAPSTAALALDAYRSRSLSRWYNWPRTPC